MNLRIFLGAAKGLAKDWARMWDQFWFSPQSLRSVSLFRAVFCSTLFIEYFIRALDIKLLFYNEGLMPANLASQFMPPFYQPFIYWFPSTNGAVLIVTVAYLSLLLILALGLVGRQLMWLAWLLHLSLIQRNYSVIYGADVVATFWLLYLSLIDSHRYFSVWSWWHRRKKDVRGTKELKSDLLSSVGMRLIQMQLCIIYAFTGWEKLKGSEWWEGTAIWQVLGNQFLASVDLSFLVHVPLVVVISTWGTLIFEIYFCVAIWIKKLRPIWLGIGILLHTGIALVMGLYFFSMVMVSAYLLFWCQAPFGSGCASRTAK